jgi:prepilin-type N-terminal cleavage/methylation domain-containing protein
METKSLFWEPSSRFRFSAFRSGVTLIEIMLVLAILVAIAGIVVPTFDGMIGSRRIVNSSENLANELSEARVTAMRTGQAQVFKATIHSRQYSITPWLDGGESINAGAGATVSTGGAIVETDSTNGGMVASVADGSDSVKQLSENVQFSAVETLVDTRNAAAIETEGGVVPTAGSAGGSADGLSSPILIYPDGSSTTAQIVIVDDRGRRMVIQLRGVAGQVSTFRTTPDTSAYVPGS